MGKRVATAHANDVIEKIERLNCPTWQKLELYQAVIDTTKGTYKPKEQQKPGWQPSRQTKPHAQHMLFCSDQAWSDAEAVLSVGLFVLHIVRPKLTKKIILGGTLLRYIIYFFICTYSDNNNKH